MNFFRPQHEYFVGLIVVQAFFSFNFPLANTFSVFRPPPPPLSFLMVRPLKLEIFREILARSEEKTHSSARAIRVLSKYLGIARTVILILISG